jgi:hypothetical protein
VKYIRDETGSYHLIIFCRISYKNNRNLGRMDKWSNCILGTLRAL